jgi:hypothetical protein
MLFETLTASFGWGGGVALICAAMLALAACAAFAPIPMHGDKTPPGYSVDSAMRLGFMATTVNSPISLLLMGANRLRWFAGGGLMAIGLLVFGLIGFNGQAALQRQLDTARGDRSALDARISALQGDVARLEQERDRAREVASTANTFLADQRRRADDAEREVRRLNEQLASASDARREAIEAQRRAQEGLGRVYDRMDDLEALLLACDIRPPRPPRDMAPDPRPPPPPRRPNQAPPAPMPCPLSR